THRRSPRPSSTAARHVWPLPDPRRHDSAVAAAAGHLPSLKKGQQPFETVVARRCRRHVAYRSGSRRMSRTSTSGANLPDDLTEPTNPAAPQSSEGFQDSDLPNGGPASWQRNSCRSGASYVAYPLASLYVVCTPACCGGDLRFHNRE